MKKLIKKALALTLSATLMLTALVFFDAGAVVSSAAEQNKAEVSFVESQSINTSVSDDEIFVSGAAQTFKSNAAVNAAEAANAVTNPFATLISMIKDLVEIIRAAIDFINADLPGLPFSVKK